MNIVTKIIASLSFLSVAGCITYTDQKLQGVYNYGGKSYDVYEVVAENLDTEDSFYGVNRDPGDDYTRDNRPTTFALVERGAGAPGSPANALVTCQRLTESSQIPTAQDNARDVKHCEGVFARELARKQGGSNGISGGQT